VFIYYQLSILFGFNVNNFHRKFVSIEVVVDLRSLFDDKRIRN